ncbi:hypothetical protein [Thiocapsa sp.]|uniref:hypothetical protein n=1 Tax=Thiocapsa sp. TaxID=2024551 RepID=UPI0035931C5E
MPPILEKDMSPEEREIYGTLAPAQKPIFLDLSPDVRALVGRSAPANACASDQFKQRICLPDSRVTAQVGLRHPTDWDTLPLDAKYADRAYKWRLKGARRGDLLLTPGGPAGMIGAMLAALKPPQDYSHMGIVVEDDGENGIVLRHCTTSEDWLNSKLFMTGKIFEGTPLEMHVPQFGFRADAVRFLWPGTISQTVEIAYKSFRDHHYLAEVYETDGAGNPLWEADEFGEPKKILRDKYAVVDGLFPTNSLATGKKFRISALTFNAVFIAASDAEPAHFAGPLVVQPCRSRQSPAVRSALARIADAAMQVRGHYRLFAYTNGLIGNADDGPPMLEARTEPYCASGVYMDDPVARTRGMVCSTMIWQALQLANADGGAPIFVDGRPARMEPISEGEDLCLRLAARNGRRRRFPLSEQLVPGGSEGLYFYSVANRKDAAKALQKALVGKVMKHIAGVLDDVTGPPVLGALEGALASLPITYVLTWHPAILASALGVGKAYLDTEIEKVRQTARYLSNQMGDTFTSDNNATGNDSTDWVDNSGTGQTVSPDDILHSWAAPYHEGADGIFGLYGSSIRAEVLSPGLVDGPWKPSTWEISVGTADVQVRVFRRGAGQANIYLADALVRIGCTQFHTKEKDDLERYQYVGALPYGSYFVFASWFDPETMWQWRSPRQIIDIPGPGHRIDIEVFQPKPTRRYVRIRGEVDLLNRHVTDDIPLIGTDPWTQTVSIDSSDIPMSLDFEAIDPGTDPEFSQWLADSYGPDVESLKMFEWPVDLRVEDWGIVRAIFTIALDDNGEVQITTRAGTRGGIDPTENRQPDWGAEFTRNVPPLEASGTPAALDFVVERAGFAIPPVRAQFRLLVENRQQSG